MIIPKLYFRQIFVVLLLSIVNDLNCQIIEFNKLNPDNDKSYFSLQFDNDTYYYTDYYYTYGLVAKLMLPVFSKVPWKAIVPKIKKSTNIKSELVLSQRLYTPKNIRDTLIQFNDRPFSATLELDQAFIANYENGTSLISTVRLGIMGPAAGGEELQKLIHEWINSPEPHGWDYQIKNGLIINYDLFISYPVFNNESLSLSVLASGRVGTLYDDLRAGMNFSLTNDRKVSKNKVKFCFSVDAMTKFIGYNALLQGNIFSKNNPYVLTYSQIRPVVFLAKISLGVSWHGIGLSVSHNYLSREFDSGIDHNYASIKLLYSF